MKSLARRIAEHYLNFEYKDLNEKVIKETKIRIIDSFAVGIAAFNALPIKIIRKIAEKYETKEGATLWGTDKKTTIDYAAFHNSSMIRYLDYNDTYLSKEALHPSDSIAGIFALAESENLSGKDLILGIVIAYELICNLADSASIRERGWDHISYIGLGTCIGLAKLLKLDYEKAEHAINLVASNVITLRQVRIGELSMWKGCSAPNAVRNSCFYTLLAKEGMTGPSPVFEGERGFFKQVSGEFDAENLFRKSYKILETSIKYYPVEYHSTSAVDAALKIYERIGSYEEIESITIDTFEVAYKIIAKDPDKWEPKTKETADHSLPYIVAHVLVNGKIDINSYNEENLKDERVKKLIKKINIRVDEEIDKMYPKSVPNRIRVKLKNGKEIVEEVIYPKGHYMNPLKDEEIERKFITLTENYLEEPKEILNKLWNIERINNLKEIIEEIKIKK